MKYLVMETHFSYAIVLDDMGRFIKCANLDYQVGQKIDRIVAMDVSERVEPTGILQRLRKFFWIPALALTFSLVFVIAGVIQQYTTFASVYMAINPEVRIDINQSETVIRLDGTNVDGEQLIQDYYFKKKHLDTVINELIDRAIDQGFLSAGGKVRIDLATRDAEWQESTRPIVRDNIERHIKDSIKIIIEIDGQSGSEKIILPVEPIIPLEPIDPDTDDSDYDDLYEDDTDYGESDDEEIDDDSPYDDSDDDDVYEWDDSDYDDSDYDD